MKPIPQPILELIQRFFSANPTFFKYVQLVAVIVACISFFPDLLTYLNVQSPSWLVKVDTVAVKVGALVAVLIAQLPNANPPALPPTPPAA